MAHRNTEFKDKKSVNHNLTLAVVLADSSTVVNIWAGELSILIQ